MRAMSGTDRLCNDGAYLDDANGSSLVATGDICVLGNRSLVERCRDHAREAAAWSANENGVGKVAGAETEALDTNRDTARLCMHRKWSTSPRWSQRTAKHPQWPRICLLVGANSDELDTSDIGEPRLHNFRDQTLFT